MGKQVGRLSIRVLPDATKFRDDVKLMVKRVEQSIAVNLKVVADTRDAEVEIRKFRTEQSAKTINMRVAANTLVAKAQIAALTRDRFTTINANVSKKSIESVQTFFAAISGGRVAEKVFSDIRSAISELDLSVGKIARSSLGIATLASSVLSGGAGIVTVTGDLLKMGNAGLILPAMFGAMAVGVGVLVAALKDSKKELATLGPSFKSLQDSISASFWSQAKAPIIDFVQSILPQLRTGFAATATSLGKQAAGIADGFKRSFGGGVLDTLFQRLTASMDIVTTGTGGFAQAVTTLGLTGSAYLPQFAQWVVNIGNSFNNWLQGAAATGELDRHIRDGIDSIKKFGSSVGSIVDIFKGIDRAATAAGATGLTSFSEKLKGAADVINGSAFQSTLTTLLGGASLGMSLLGDGLKAIGKTVADLAPTLSGIFTVAGGAIGTLLTDIANALKEPAFQKGLSDLFSGIASGLQAIGPALPVVADLLGQLGSTVGTMAANFGPLLAVLKETFAPVLDGLLKSLTPLVDTIGTALVNAISFVMPGFQAFGSFLGDNPQLVQGFALAIGALVAVIKTVQFGTFIAGWVATTAAMLASKAETLAIVALYAKDFVVAMAKGAAGIAVSTGKWIANTAALIANKVQTLAIVALYAKDLIVNLVKSAAGLAVQTGAWIANTAATIAAKVAMIAGAVASGIATAAQWALNVAMTANPIGIIVVAIAALVAGLIWFFTQTDLGKEIWSNFVSFLSDAWNNIVSFIGTAVQVVADIIGSIGATIGAIWSAIWNGIIAVVQFIWNAIVLYVQTYIAVLVAIVTTVGNAISTVWNAIWNGIVAFVTFVWNLIVAGVTAQINLIVAIVTAVGNAISSVWNAIWNGISSFVSGVWNGIVSFVQTGIGLALSVITSVGNTISGIWNGIWSGLGKAVSGAWTFIQGIVSNIVNGISGMVTNIGSFLGQIPKKIGDAFAGAGTWLLDSGKAIIQGLIDGIGNMINAAKNAAKGVMDAIANFFPHSPAKEGPFSGRGWTPYSGMALVDGFADGIDSRVSRVRASALSMMNAASGTATVDLAGADAAGQALLSRAAGMGDHITVEGNVGYNPQEIADELNLKKRQAALRNGIGQVVVK